MTAPTEQERPSFVRSLRLFQGSRGERVEEMTLCDEVSGMPLTDAERTSRGIAEPLVRYVGIVPMVNNIPTPYGVVQIPTDTRFQIQAASPGEAIANYPKRVEEIDRRLREHQQQMMEEAQRQAAQEQIVVPTAEEVQAVNNEGLKLIRP